MSRQVGQDRPRLVVVDELRLSASLDPYLGLRALAAYASCSVRWLRERLADPHHPLPCFRLPGGKVLVKRGDFDAWIARYRQLGRADVHTIVEDVLADLGR